jgi:hypothetical protein
MLNNINQAIHGVGKSLEGLNMRLPTTPCKNNFEEENIQSPFKLAAQVKSKIQENNLKEKSKEIKERESKQLKNKLINPNPCYATPKPEGKY